VRKEAEKGAQASKKKKLHLNLIPKPKGSPGDGYNLQKEMRLEDKPQKYNAILVRP
jgi:hypothetical protein